MIRFTLSTVFARCKAALPGSTGEAVISGSTREAVMPGLTGQAVIAVSTQEAVIAGSTREAVIAGSTRNPSPATSGTRNEFAAEATSTPGDGSRARPGMTALVLGALALVFGAGSVSAQDFPTHPIRIIVPYPPGGGTDTVARLAAARMSIAFGQQVVVENKAGASANIGTEAVAKAAPDGYTILVTAPNFTTSEALFDKPGWKFDDFTPVIQLVRYGNVLVAGPGTQVTNVQALIAAAKAAPKSLTYGSAGTGSNSHLAMELFKTRAGFTVEHVPYKGSGPLKTDLLGGHLPLGVDGLGGLSDLIKAGKLRPLAVLAPRRSTLAPDIPSLGDIGINDVDGNGWYGALVPAGTPAPIVARLHAAFAAALQSPDMKERMVSIGVEPVGSSPEEFKAYLLGERKKWAQVIKSGNIKAE